MSDPLPIPAPRLAVRALLVNQGRLLLVNAYKGLKGGLWCAPGGGVERGSSLPDNLKREVFEECGLRIEVGALALVNEFHDPRGSFHQVELFFHCTLAGSGEIGDWQDSEGVVSHYRWASQADLATLHAKPDALAAVAFGPAGAAARYDPLEPIIR
ncbi:hypothetical protein AQS8620_00534 [Aquimixticola soesokkakensis]|uniref:Nudix hydrolase domain-containing protein n=1 Tax=Aquimixticola soesokkakensis TaxID=1519096 RepID=A0A1Y5RNN1_9RHOB|nr:NUDIX hydrolase [Aquimixticola soesokkakensis]SLN20585.1 hypothetical protein AQS8620_00534 [Aquimixticola soesokkakensis]